MNFINTALCVVVTFFSTALFSAQYSPTKRAFNLSHSIVSEQAGKISGRPPLHRNKPVGKSRDAFNQPRCNEFISLPKNFKGLEAVKDAAPIYVSSLKRSQSREFSLSNE